MDVAKSSNKLITIYQSARCLISKAFNLYYIRTFHLTTRIITAFPAFRVTAGIATVAAVQFASSGVHSGFISIYCS